MSVQLFYLYKNFSLTNRTQLKSFLPLLCKKEGKKLEELQIIFCSDDYLLDINRQYLQHDYYTDIITFDYTIGNAIKGELYISIERVKENTVLHNTSFKQELHRVVFHGVLHLCGYADKLKKDQIIMREKEERYLSLYFQRKQKSST